jgi:hypothetical protein
VATSFGFDPLQSWFVEYTTFECLLPLAPPPVFQPQPPPVADAGLCICDLASSARASQLKTELVLDFLNAARAECADDAPVGVRINDTLTVSTSSTSTAWCVGALLDDAQSACYGDPVVFDVDIGMQHDDDDVADNFDIYYAAYEGVPRFPAQLP